MGLGFGGEVAEFYARFRRGYPAAVLDAVVAAFRLAADDVVVDLGCGTGQLALPLAGRVRAVGMDFADGVRRAVHPYRRFTNHVRVATLHGRIR